METKRPAPTPAPAAAPAKPVEPKKTEEELAAEKAQKEAAEVEATAAAKAGLINANLIKDGSPRRVQGGVRNGEEKYFWGNFVPTQELTDEELAAAKAKRST